MEIPLTFEFGPPGQTKSFEHMQGPRWELHPSISRGEEAKSEGGPSPAQTGRTQPDLPLSGRTPSAVASILLSARFLTTAQLPVCLQTSPLPLAYMLRSMRGIHEQKKEPGHAA